MSNPTEAFTRNKFVDKCMSFIPDDPLTQSKYMYSLTAMVFLGLLGFAVATWWGFFITYSMKNLFSGIFMTAIAVLSMFGVKQTRNAYHTIKSMYAIRPPNLPKEEKEGETKDIKVENAKEMLDEFK